jgi:hypothetical protein
MVRSELEEDGMVGIPAPAGGEDEAHSATSHLSVVSPEGVDPPGTDATIIEITHVRPEAAERQSIIYAW